MDKLPWAKYHFSFWIVAIIAAMTAKYLTENILILSCLSIVLYWLSVKGFSTMKEYR